MGTRKRTGGGKPTNLYQREGIFYARAQINGRERRRSLKTGNRREAEKRLSQWLKELSPYHGTIRAQFKDAAALWIAAGDWKKKTFESYLKLLAGLTAHFGDAYWDEIDKAALQGFILARQDRGSGTATINRYLTVVSGIADHVREIPGWPEVNPVKLLARKPRREKPHVYKRPPGEHIEFIFARMQGTFGDLCRLALLTGARRDELALLKRQDAEGGKLQLWDTKSGFRVIPLTPDAQAIVARQPISLNSDHLFNTRNDGPYRRVTEMWREVVGRAQKAAQKDGRKLHTLRFHDLRHEYAIRYLESGGSLYTLQKLLGHGSIRQTEAYLRYLSADQDATVVKGSAQN